MSGYERPRPRIITTEGKAVGETAALDKPRDITAWPKRRDVGELLGCGIHKVRTFEQRGKLHPLKDENGDWRFDPDEVGSLCIDLGIDDDATAEWKAKAYARIDLFASNAAYKLLNDNVRAMSVRSGQIDDRNDRYVSRIEARNDYLEKKNDELRKRLDEVHELKQSLQDNADERAIVKAVVLEKEARITQVWTRIADNVQRFLFGNESSPSVSDAFLASLTACELEIIKGGMADTLNAEKMAQVDAALERRAKLDAEAAAQAGHGPAKTEAQNEDKTNAA